MAQIKLVVGVWFVVLGSFISFKKTECGAAAGGVDAALRVLQQSRNFTTVLSLLRSSGIDLALQALDQVTFLAPSDAAYTLLPDGELGTLNHQHILDVLSLHAIPSYLPISSLHSNSSFQSFSGERITFFRPSRSSLLVRCGRLDGADVVSIVYDQFPVAFYSVDRVLLPPSLQNSPLPPPIPVPSLSPAPAPAPAPASVPSISPAPAAHLQRENSTLLDVLENISGFSTLVSLIYACRLDKKLESLPMLTYLAPTDQAFTSLSKPTLRKLTDSQLTALLEFHGIPEFFAGFRNVINPLATLVTNESSNRGKYLLHIQQRPVNGTRVETIAHTGVEQARISGPLFVQSPRLAVFAVEKLLLPPELSWVSNIKSAAPAHPPVAMLHSPAQSYHPVGVLWLLVVVGLVIAM